MPLLTPIGSAVLAGITFVVLFVILSVPLWVSLVAAGGVLVAGAALTAASILETSPDSESAPLAPEVRRRGVITFLEAPLTVPGLAIAGGAFVVMYAAIGIPLWVSILAAGVLLGAYSMAADAVEVQRGEPRTTPAAESQALTGDGHGHERRARVTGPQPPRVTVSH